LKVIFLNLFTTLTLPLVVSNVFAGTQSVQANKKNAATAIEKTAEFKSAGASNGV
jgi:ABC-type proline/glycine betaine transport system permease subunit